MDVDMPGMNGFEAADRIVLLDPKARILMSSGYRVDHAEIDRRGLLGLLEKPYDSVRLLAAIESALAGAARS
jgi:CheY-like chemotaxis protein